MSNQPLLKLKRINQVCLVVRDLDRTMEAYWRLLGVGPWRVYTYGPPLVKQTTYHDRPEPHHMRIALAEVGGLRFELIQHLDGDTVYKDFIDRAGEGVQHLGIFVEDLDEALEEARRAGFRVLQTGRGHGLHGDGGFAYLDTEAELGVVYELIQPPSKRHPPERVYPPQ